MSRGFGLIEVLVVVAVIAILATVAVPNFTTLIQDNRISSQALDLLVALRTAQSEARKSGSVSLCANSAGPIGEPAGSSDRNQLHPGRGRTGNPHRW